MKHLLILVFVSAMIISCNDKAATTGSDASKDTATATAAVPEETLTYAYALDSPYRDWQPGDKKHAAMVMKSLKAYEDGDIASCITAFGDSVSVRFDGYSTRVNRDSLQKILTDSRQQVASTKVHMQDWESVISKDKKHEYVTLWYKEVTTDKKGKTDSLAIVDDLKIVNGKIVELDQKIQHYPSKKM